MNRRSVRWRITLLASLVVVVVLTIIGVVVIALVQERLYANLDASLDQRADQIEALALTGDSSALANRNAEDRFAQILDSDGTVVGATPNLDAAPPLIDVSKSGSEHSATTRHDLPLEDDDYRVLVRRFDVSDTVHFVVVGENVDDLRDTIAALRAVVVILLPIAVAAITAMVWWLVGRTLRSVEAIRRKVEGIGLDQLDKRVPAPRTGDEIDLLAETMNDMLARLESSVAQQRSLIADASHELRTPLTRLRTLLEVDAARTDVDLEATTREALLDVTRMQALIDDLLFLARVDAGCAHRPSGPIDLDAVVETEVAAARTNDGPRITIAADPVMVVGNAPQVARLVRNLLTNALRHADTNVHVAVRSPRTPSNSSSRTTGPEFPPAPASGCSTDSCASTTGAMPRAVAAVSASRSCATSPHSTALRSTSTTANSEGHA